MAVIEKYRDAATLWRTEMVANNRILKRGVIMGLCPLRKGHFLPTADALDQHIMQMHCSALREALDALASFAERVTPCITRAPAAVMWPIRGPILITRTRWMLFCRRVMALLRLLGLATNDATAFNTRRWPDADQLLRAAARTRATFGRFAAHRSRPAAVV
jgi:hypothetical protein